MDQYLYSSLTGEDKHNGAETQAAFFVNSSCQKVEGGREGRGGEGRVLWVSNTAKPNTSTAKPQLQLW